MILDRDRRDLEILVVIQFVGGILDRSHDLGPDRDLELVIVVILVVIVGGILDRDLQFGGILDLGLDLGLDFGLVSRLGRTAWLPSQKLLAVSWILALILRSNSLRLTLSFGLGWPRLGSL